MSLKQMGSDDVTKDAKDNKIGSLIVENVKVLTRTVEVDKPIYKDKIIEIPKVKYVDEIITVTKPKIVEEIVKTQNVTVDETTVEVERPVFTDVPVDRPIFKDVEVLRVNIKEEEKVIEVPRVVQKTKVIEEELIIKVPKLVEEIVRVPRIQYVPTEVERIVWKDVPRERCSSCGKEI